MDAERLRREIAHQAAQLLYRKQENSFFEARWRAARSITRRYLPTAALPTDFEIRQALDQVMGEIPAISESVSTTRKRDRLLGLLLPLDRVRWKSRTTRKMMFCFTACRYLNSPAIAASGIVNFMPQPCCMTWVRQLIVNSPLMQR